MRRSRAIPLNAGLFRTERIDGVGVGSGYEEGAGLRFWGRGVAYVLGIPAGLEDRHSCSNRAHISLLLRV